jgi:hypothetical protein
MSSRPLVFGCVTLLGILATGLTAGRVTAVAAEEQTVLRHVVMYKFKPELTAAQVQEVVDAFKGLPGKIPTIVEFEAGTNVSEEGKSEGFTHLFVVTFRDKAGLKVYLDHPAHADYVKVVKDRREKVIVFDYLTETKK